MSGGRGMVSHRALGGAAAAVAATIRTTNATRIRRIVPGDSQSRETYIESVYRSWMGRRMLVLLVVGCGGNNGSGTDSGGGPVVDSSPITPPGTTCGAPVTPVDTSTPDHVVGDGTPESCTEAALGDRDSRPAARSRSRAAATATIAITTTLDVRTDVDTTIDGGNQVTLDGGDAVRILSFDHARLSRQHTRCSRSSTSRSRTATRTARCMYAPAPAPCSQGYYDGYGGALYFRDGELVVIDTMFVEQPGRGARARRRRRRDLAARRRCARSIANSTFHGQQGLERRRDQLAQQRARRLRLGVRRQRRRGQRREQRRRVDVLGRRDERPAPDRLGRQRRRDRHRRRRRHHAHVLRRALHEQPERPRRARRRARPHARQRDADHGDRSLHVRRQHGRHRRRRYFHNSTLADHRDDVLEQHRDQGQRRDPGRRHDASVPQPARSRTTPRWPASAARSRCSAATARSRSRRSRRITPTVAIRTSARRSAATRR